MRGRQILLLLKVLHHLVWGACTAWEAALGKPTGVCNFFSGLLGQAPLALDSSGTTHEVLLSPLFNCLPARLPHWATCAARAALHTHTHTLHQLAIKPHHTPAAGRCNPRCQFPRPLQERDALQLAALESDFEAHLAAAVAAAAADGEQAAAAAGDAFTASQEAAKARLQEQAAAARAAARAAQAPAAAREQRTEPSLLRQRGGAAAAKQGGGGGGAAVAGGPAEEDAAAAAALEELEGRGRRDGGGTADEDEENLPEWLKGGFSWKVRGEV